LAVWKFREAWIVLFAVYIPLCHKAQFSAYRDPKPIVDCLGILGINYCLFARERRPRIALVVSLRGGIRVSWDRRDTVYVEDSVFVSFKHGCVVSQLTCKPVVFCCINWENFAPLSTREVLNVRERDDHGNLGLVTLGAAI